jgi:UDP-N-acetylmuramyl pentapeptide phosphotransferase/UDP-N-acetylglucosamine-1-phosphate transferase
MRLRQKKSPFSPDKTHIHHLLLETGYNHKRSAIVLYISNLIIIASGFLLRNLNPGFSIPVLIIIAIFLTEMLNLRRLLVNQIKQRFLRKKADEILTQNRLLMKNLKNLDKK